MQYAHNMRAQRITAQDLADFRVLDYGKILKLQENYIMHYYYRLCFTCAHWY